MPYRFKFNPLYIYPIYQHLSILFRILLLKLALKTIQDDEEQIYFNKSSNRHNRHIHILSSNSRKQRQN
ncbi:hypothetical protein ESCNG_20041 [Neisseria gonorrhoeae]|nr:hypothetical protein ESCNG_20041 [Neisseria gonorrhoeae]